MSLGSLQAGENLRPRQGTILGLFLPLRARILAASSRNHALTFQKRFSFPLVRGLVFSTAAGLVRVLDCSDRERI